MTVALVANSTWNIYNFRLNLIKALVSKGIRVIVIAPVDEYIHYLNKVEGIHHIPLKRLTRDSTSPIQDLRLVWELYTIYRRIKPDLIIHYTIKPNIYGNLSAFFARVKSISIVTGLGYSFLKEGWIKSLTMFQYRWSLKSANAVVFHNPDDQKLFEDSKILKVGKASTILGSGVDTQYFKPVKSYSQKTVFTFIGRLLYDKGIEEFVTAAKKMKQDHPNVEFWVIGEMDEKNPSYVPKQKLVNWIENKDIRYFGTTQDVREFIADSSCIILPSYREGLSKVLIEALAMGKPIITTNIPGCRQVVENNKNGLLVPVKNSDALALAMEYFFELPQARKESMGQYSREMAIKYFDDEVIIEKYFEIIAKVLDEKSLFRRKPKVHSK
jgi:glycosyltransferase involved in cell wall biosynthesis